MSTKEILKTLTRSNLSKDELKILLRNLRDKLGLVSDSDASEGETDTVDDDTDTDDSSVDDEVEQKISPEESAAISRTRIAEHDVQVAQENVNVEKKKLIIQQEKLDAYATEILDSTRTTVEAHMKLTMMYTKHIIPSHGSGYTYQDTSYTGCVISGNPIIHTPQRVQNTSYFPEFNNSGEWRPLYSGPSNTVSPPVVAALEQLAKDYLKEYRIAYNQLTALNDSWTDVNKYVIELTAKILEYKRVLESAVVIRDKRILELEAVRRKEKQAR